MRSTLGDAVQTGVEVEIFLDAEVFVEPETLRHVGDAILNLLRLARHVDAVDRQRSGVRPHQAGDEPDQRGLAGAVGTDQRGERAVRHLDRDIVERHDDVAGLAAKLLAQIAADDWPDWSGCVAVTAVRPRRSLLVAPRLARAAE